MSIPDLPPFSDMKWVDPEGNLTPDSFLYNDDFSQSLNHTVQLLNLLLTSRITTALGSVPVGTVINDGVKMPNKTTSEINTLEPDAAIGTMWFDTTIAKLKVKTASGTIETITSS